jgi:hypothetical protein
MGDPNRRIESLTQGYLGMMNVISSMRTSRVMVVRADYESFVGLAIRLPMLQLPPYLA